VALGSAFGSVAATAYGRHPDGDAGLFAPGGLATLDLLRHSLMARGPLLSALFIGLATAHLAGLVPYAAAFAHLARRTGAGRAPPAHDSIARAVAAAPASFAVGVLTLAVQAGVLGFGLALTAGSSPALEARLGVPHGDEVSVALAALTVAAATFVGIAGEAGRAAVVHRELRSTEALALGARTLARHPIRLGWSYAWRTIAGWTPVVIVAAVTPRLGGRAGWPLLTLAALHQAVLLARIAIRTSWMARLLRALDG
jgi:hypothetical protein